MNFNVSVNSQPLGGKFGAGRPNPAPTTETRSGFEATTSDTEYGIFRSGRRSLPPSRLDGSRRISSKIRGNWLFGEGFGALRAV